MAAVIANQGCGHQLGRRSSKSSQPRQRRRSTQRCGHTAEDALSRPGTREGWGTSPSRASVTRNLRRKVRHSRENAGETSSAEILEDCTHDSDMEKEDDEPAEGAAENCPRSNRPVTSSGYTRSSALTSGKLMNRASTAATIKRVSNPEYFSSH